MPEDTPKEFMRGARVGLLIGLPGLAVLPLIPAVGYLTESGSRSIGFLAYTSLSVIAFVGSMVLLRRKSLN